jgi:hypothetical protein
MYGPHVPMRRCRFCHGCKGEPNTLTTCQVSKDGQHYWELELKPVPREKRPGWWLMALFTWDVLFTKNDEDF